MQKKTFIDHKDVIDAAFLNGLQDEVILASEAAATAEYAATAAALDITRVSSELTTVKSGVASNTSGIETLTTQVGGLRDAVTSTVLAEEYQSAVDQTKEYRIYQTVGFEPGREYNIKVEVIAAQVDSKGIRLYTSIGTSANYVKDTIGNFPSAKTGYTINKTFTPTEAATYLCIRIYATGGKPHLRTTVTAVGNLPTMIDANKDEIDAANERIDVNRYNISAAAAGIEALSAAMDDVQSVLRSRNLVKTVVMGRLSTTGEVVDNAYSVVTNRITVEPGKPYTLVMGEAHSVTLGKYMQDGTYTYSNVGTVTKFHWNAMAAGVKEIAFGISGSVTKVEDVTNLILVQTEATTPEYTPYELMVGTEKIIDFEDEVSRVVQESGASLRVEESTDLKMSGSQETTGRLVIAKSYGTRNAQQYKISVTPTFDSFSTTQFRLYFAEALNLVGNDQTVINTTSLVSGRVYTATVTADASYPLLRARFDEAQGTVSLDITMTKIKDLRGAVTSEDVKNDFVRYPYAEIHPKLVATTNDFHDGNLTFAPVNLIHYSDPHGYDAMATHVQEFRERYSNYVDDVIVTGDIVAKTFADYTGKYRNPGFDKFLLAIGNHDVYDVDGLHPDEYSDQSHWATDPEKYEQYFAPQIEGWGVVQPSDAATAGKCYYYKDYSKSTKDGTTKVRLIVLDGMAYTTDQHQWLSETLASARTGGYSVVIAVHFQPQEQSQRVQNLFDTGFSSKMTGMEYAYGVSYLSYDQTTGHSATQLVDDFLDAGGDFVCWLCGHLHYGQVGTLNTRPRQIFIAIEKAATTDTWADTPRFVGDPSEDLYNLVSIDTHNKMIRVLRIGANYDMYMRHKESMCIDYANRRLVSTF